MSDEIPVYLFDIDLAFLAPDPIEPPPGVLTDLNLEPYAEASSNLNLEPYAGD